MFVLGLKAFRLGSKFPQSWEECNLFQFCVENKICLVTILSYYENDNFALTYEFHIFSAEDMLKKDRTIQIKPVVLMISVSILEILGIKEKYAYLIRKP